MRCAWAREGVLELVRVWMDRGGSVWVDGCVLTCGLVEVGVSGSAGVGSLNRVIVGVNE